MPLLSSSIGKVCSQEPKFLLLVAETMEENTTHCKEERAEEHLSKLNICMSMGLNGMRQKC